MSEAVKDIEELSVTTVQFQFIKSKFRKIFEKGFEVFKKAKLVFKSLVNFEKGLAYFSSAIKGGSSASANLGEFPNNPASSCYHIKSYYQINDDPAKNENEDWKVKQVMSGFYWILPLCSNIPRKIYC